MRRLICAVALVAAWGVAASPAWATAGGLWTTGTAGTKNWGLGMMDRSSPSIAGLSNNGYEIAFQANTGWLWTVGDAGWTATKLGLNSASSPSIAGSPAGGFESAFSAYTGADLWDEGSAVTNDFNLGMQPGTSPSIAALTTGGGYEMAFATNGDKLAVTGAADQQTTDLGLWPGTSPSVARLTGGGYEVAFEAYTGADLWVYGSAGTVDTGIVMAQGASPSIAGLSGGGYEVAYRGTNGDMWSYTPSGGVHDWGTVLDAAAPAGTTQVNFFLHTPTRADVLIGPGYATRYGWLYSPNNRQTWGWDSSQVANGNVSITCEAVQPNGATLSSTAVPVGLSNTQNISVSASHGLRVGVWMSWKWAYARTWLAGLQFRHLPRRATVQVSCRGRGCAGRLVSASSGRLGRLLRSLERRTYWAGDRLAITISKPGYKPERASVQIRYGLVPTLKLVKRFG